MSASETEVEVLSRLGCADAAEAILDLFSRVRIDVHCGVRRLQIAMLETAVSDALRARPMRARYGGDTSRETALAWIHGEYGGWDEAPDTTTFAGICESLGLDAEWLRAGIRAAMPGRPRAIKGRDRGGTRTRVGSRPRGRHPRERSVA